MKQKIYLRHFFFPVIIFFALLLPAGSNFCFYPADAATKKTAAKNYVDGEAVAKFASDTNPDSIAVKYNLDITLLKSSPDGNLYILQCRDAKFCVSTEKMIKQLQKDPQIISVQPNYKYKPLARVPNDRYFSQEWPLADTANSAGGVSAPSAWDMEAKNQTGVPIAVIDSGISYVQPDLAGRITGGQAKGKNFTNPKRKPQDTDGHGTFLSGIIAAKTNNRKGIAGASFFGKFKIMPLKFDFTTTQAISAISYAKVRHIPVVNASWGGYGEDGLDLALKDAIAAYPGIFVTASGNGDPDTELGYNHDFGDPAQKMYPCDFDLANIICVGASDKNGSITGYSDYGAVSVDVVAPGGTDDNPLFGLDKKKNKYTWAEGSSLSTAFVTAEAGLIISKYPRLGASQIIEIIKNSVDLEPSLVGKVLSGGKINFQKALQLAGNY